MTYAEGEEPNPFDQFETSAELLAFISAKYGPGGLREALQAMLDQSPHATRESLEDDASELQEIGLTKAAAIVREAAHEAPPALSLCPYDLDSCNGRSWLRSERWRLARRRHGVNSPPQVQEPPRR